MDLDYNISIVFDKECTMRREPKPYEIFTHFKGKKYQIIAVAEHSETGEKCVVYQAMYDDFSNYVRPYDMFMGEVDHDKYPDVKYRYRFFREDEAGQLFDAAQEAAKDEAEEGQPQDTAEWDIDPLVLDFLDADTYDARLNILAELHPRITDGMINTMAVAVDVEIDDGPVENRYEELKICLMTRDKYERIRY